MLFFAKLCNKNFYLTFGALHITVLVFEPAKKRNIYVVSAAERPKRKVFLQLFFLS